MVVRYFHAFFSPVIADQSISGQLPEVDVTQNKIIHQMNSNDDFQYFKQDLLHNRVWGVFSLPELRGAELGADLFAEDENGSRTWKIHTVNKVVCQQLKHSFKT